MPIVTIPGGTPLVVNKKDKISLARHTVITKELLAIVEETGVSAIKILEKLYPTERFFHVKVTSDFVNNSKLEKKKTYRKAEKDEVLEFDEEEQTA